jgi:hypothetical protein
VKLGLAALPLSGATLAAAQGFPRRPIPIGHGLRSGWHDRPRGPLAESDNFNKPVVENGLQER